MRAALPASLTAVAVSILGICLAWGPAVVAQDRPKPPPSNGAAGATDIDHPEPGGQIREVEPSIIYVENAQGRLVEVINMQYEDFERLWKLDKKLTHPNTPPRYSLQQLSVSGTAEGDRASLDIEVKVLTRDDNWVRVPLKLNTAVLREPIRYEGPGLYFTHFDEEGDGYIGWIRGPAGKEHTLHMKVLAPLVQLGGRTRLALAAPRSTTSQLKMTVPVDRATGVVNEGASLLAPKYPGPGKTEFTALGLGGDFQLAWRGGDERPAKVPTVLEADGAVLVRVGGPNDISAEARLRVQIRGGGVEAFGVRLPPGAKLVPGVYSGYEVVPVPKAGAEAAKGPRSAGKTNGGRTDGPLVEIKLDTKTTGPAEIRLAVELEPADAGRNQLVEVAGFDVVGALRQGGHIALAVEGDQSAHWVEGRNVHRVDELPDALRDPAVVASFEYVAQPCSLKIRTVPKTKRVRAAPVYLLTVKADQVLLEARVAYSVRGAKSDFVDVDLTGWEVDRIEPEDLVRTEAAAPEQVSPLIIPLAGPPTRDFEIRIFAHRPVAPEATSLSVPLPLPRADTLAPATIVVQPDDNVELTPQPDEMRGLLPEPLPLALELPRRQQEPLYYGDRAGPEPSTFVSGFQVHPRSVSVAVSGRVALGQGQVEVEQTFSYRIDYEKLGQLTFRAPPSLADPDKLDVQLDGQPVDRAALRFQAAGEAAEGPTELTVSLPPGGKIGPCKLVLRHTVPLGELSAGESLPVTIPLVMPAGDEVKMTGNRIQVTSGDAIHVEPLAGDWMPGPSAAPTDNGAPAGLDLIAQGPADELALLAARVEPEDRGSTVVEKAWVQTWLSSSARQDRAMFRLVTNESEIRLRLPGGVRPAGLVVLVNGQERAPENAGQREIRIPLPAEAPRRAYLLELSYPMERGRPARGAFSIDFPQIVGACWVRRMYWQLVTPRDEHLIIGPKELTPEASWGRQNMFWGPQARLTQAQLEKWIGATEQKSPDGANQYLFSSFGALKTARVRTASRLAILLVASGAALAVGLILIYFPAVRHPGVLFSAGVVLAACGVAWPGPGLLAAQAAALGLVLTPTARLLAWVFAWRRGGRAVVWGTSAAGLEAPVVELSPMPGAGSSRVTTATAPYPVQVSPPNEES